MRASIEASEQQGLSAPPRADDEPGRPALRLRRSDPVRLQLSVEMAALDTELLRRPRHVPFVRSELAQDVCPLEGLARLLEGAVTLGVLPGGELLASAQGRGQVLR